MLTRPQKEEQVAELREKFGRASSIYLADYRGLDVEAVDALRRRIRSEGAGDYEYRVAKNAVLRRAAEGSDVEPAAQYFSGPTALALSYGDPLGLARILSEFARDHDVFEIKGGVVEGRPVAAGEVARLATLPSLEVLRAGLVGLILAPATKLARLLQTPAGQLARVLQAQSEKQAD